MARTLGRSRSMRILKGGRKEVDRRATESSTPLPDTLPTDIHRLKADTPVGIETQDMQRPMTSGGPGDRSTLFHKKVTPAYQTNGPEFSFPFTTSPNKSATFLYAAQVHEEREGIIGIALGSPTMASQPASWHPSPRPTDFVTDSQGTITHISSNGWSPFPDPRAMSGDNQQEAAKPKLSRWKSLFKKTAPPRPVQDKDTFYQLAQSVVPARADSHHDDDSIHSASVTGTDESPSATSPPTYAFNPEIRESRKLPKGKSQPEKDTRPRALALGVSSPATKGKTSFLRSMASPRAAAKNDGKKSPGVPQLTVSGSSPNSSPNSSPLLDVDIPTVHMERYSVMFSNLLQQNASGQNHGGSSTLLQRRQGNSERLRPLDPLSTKNEQNSLPKPPRRATSPIPTSAGFSLFPSANVSRAPSPLIPAMHRPRPLQRARTAPTNSPHRASFPKQEDDAEESAHAPSQGDKITPGETLSPAPTPHSRATTPSDRSFDSDSEEITIVSARAAPGQARKPLIEQLSPQWEIVSKPVGGAVTKASALRSHPSTRKPSSAPLEPPSPTPSSAPRSPTLSRSKSQTLISPKSQSFNVSLATVGVARSVSVSRANKPASLVKPGFLSPGSAGRIVDSSKPLTPTLVELTNRKSQRVQLVDA